MGIMFDTQVIIRKARNGDKDFIAHSLDLFIDFVQIFRKVLILLMQKDERDNKNKRRRIDLIGSDVNYSIPFPNYCAILMSSFDELLMCQDEEHKSYFSTQPL